MHRLDHDTLYLRIHNLIQCSRIKRHKHIPIVHSLESHEGQRELAKLICEAIDNDSTMIIRTDFIGFPHQRHGKWDVDEPAPAKVPEPPKPPSNGGR